MGVDVNIRYIIIGRVFPQLNNHQSIERLSYLRICALRELPCPSLQKKVIYVQRACTILELVSVSRYSKPRLSRIQVD